MNPQKYPIMATKDERKLGIFNVWLEVTPAGIFRCHEPEAFEVEGIAAETEQPAKKKPCTLRPFWMFADSDPMDDSAESGVLLKVGMRDGRIVDRFITGPEIESRRIFETLRSLGIRVRSEPHLRSAITQYLTNFDAPEVVRTYGRSGWTSGPNGRVFVLGSEVIGDDSGRFESTANPPSACTTRGTVESWINDVAKPAKKSPIWSFAICAAFAAPLMELLNFTSEGGWHFYGGTSTGKTLALECAASVFGPPQSTDGSRYIQTWNTTEGGIEWIAETYNGLLLCLDELGEASPRAAAQGVYTLSDGQGRKRLTREAKAQRVRSWRVLSMSSGEVSIEDKIKECGRTLRGGQALRIADIWAEHDDLRRSIPEAARDLKIACVGSYGVVGLKWVQRLVELVNEKPEELKTLRADFDQICAQMQMDIDDPRRARASQRFALVRIAAELAQRFELLPDSYNVREIVNQIFGVWSKDTAAVTLNENQQAARRLLDFIDEQTGTTIQEIDADNDLIGEIRQTRAGWIRESFTSGGKHHAQRVYLLKKALDAAIGEYNLRAFCRAMAEAKILHQSQGKNPKLTYPTPYFSGRYHTQKNLPRTYQFDVCALRQFIGEESEEPKQPEQPEENPKPKIEGANKWILKKSSFSLKAE